MLGGTKDFFSAWASKVAVLHDFRGKAGKLREDLFGHPLRHVAVSREVSVMRSIGWGLSIVLLALLMVGSARAQAPARSAGIFVADAGNARIVRISDLDRGGLDHLRQPGPRDESV